MAVMRASLPVKFGGALRMELLWLAIVFYTVGLGAVLYFRPAVMFNENGTWKEFGYQRDSRHTIFPFWLFVITWAIISYMMSMIVSSSLLGATTGIAATATAATSVSVATPAHSYAAHMFDDVIEMPDESDEEEAAEPVRQERQERQESARQERQEPARQEPARQERSKPPPKEKPRPGYYVLEEGDQTKGLRKYVYYGPKPPA